MINTGKLAGRTLFITGASRGIGKAIALKAARDGANIIIAAKTSTPHSKLLGTIYTTAEEVERVGGRAYPCVVDVRNEEQVCSAIADGVSKFGGIDILVNNASAISLSNTLTTDMKHYDLMHQINTRGTFLVSKTCLPHLIKSNHAHILNISPPLNLDPIWFAPHVAYTMAKYGMSMCVLGMAYEYRTVPVAVNALWPRTVIHTAGAEMLTGPNSMNLSRKVDIMADAAYAVLIREPAQCTGRFLIDEEVLTEAGVIDLKQYAFNPAYADQLMYDFFLDIPKDRLIPIRTKDLTDPVDEQLKGRISALFERIASFLSPDIVRKTQAIYQFNVEGDEKGIWFLDLRNGEGTCGIGPPKVMPDVTLTMKSQDFFDMFTGKINPATAFVTGKFKIAGDLNKALKLGKLMRTMKTRV